MPLFVVRHSRQGERCPAQDPYMGAMLLNHLSRPNVRQHGVEIHGEAVVQGEHTMYLIVEAPTRTAREFMQPFQMAGSVDVFPASDLRPRRGQRRLRRAAARCPSVSPRWTPRRPASTRSTPGSWCTAPIR